MIWPPLKAEMSLMLNNIKNEFKIFITALTFYTRIPCYQFADFNNDRLERTAKYFPLVGFIIGMIAAGAYILMSLVCSHSVSVLISIITTIILTGAFHEDGFADTCDGFGGGQDKKQILTIMKDSRLGTYGAIGIFFILLAKFVLLLDIPLELIVLTIITGHTLSRAGVLITMFIYQYAYDNDEISKSKPMAKSISIPGLLFGMFTGVLPLYLMGPSFTLGIIPIVITALLMGHYFKKRIDGYTGDCLGAIQQVNEVIFYFFIVVATWKFI